MKLWRFDSIKLALCLRATSIKHSVKMPQLKASGCSGLEGRAREERRQMVPFITQSVRGQGTFPCPLIPTLSISLCGQCRSLEISIAAKTEIGTVSTFLFL